MASTSFSIFCLILTILSTTSTIQSSAGDVPPTIHITPSAACDYTTYPHFCCSSILPRHGSATLHDYSRLALSQSLSAARRLSSLINSHLARAPPARALQDCAHLSDLSIDYLSEVRAALNSTQPLPDARLDEFKSLLSAVITNHQTCLDALRETPSIRRAFSNGAKLYSVSLSLFTRAWVKRRPDNTRSEIVRNGELVAKMSDRHVKVFESWSGRSVVQDPGGVFINDMVVVSKNGTGDFTNITDALGAVPESTSVNDGYFLIYVTAGTYEECVTVNKTQMFVMMIGDGINRTIITGDHSNSTGWSTFGSATVGVTGRGFVAMNITMRNTAGPSGGQAVALMSNSDMSVFYGCSFEGYQDTLYTHSARQFYRECDIYGTVDFIFGDSQAVFQNCNIYPRLFKHGHTNTITAQGRNDPALDTGISIQGCTIKGEPALEESSGGGYATKTFLGRPWGEYSRTVIMESYLDSLIEPAGWLRWNSDSVLKTLYYGEFNNTGPGSNTSGRVTWPGFHVMNTTDAVNFTVSNFILGNNWLPLTGVAYHGGL